jgi:DNA-binding response OmpR family regulator
MKILIVDKDEQMADLLSFYALPLGLTCVLRSTASEAMKFLATNKVEFIIMETNLPDMDEVNFCREIVEARKIPFMIVSENVSQEDMIKGLKLGADDYVIKPYYHNELIERVMNVLKRRYSFK